MAIFIDASVLVAYANLDDIHKDKARNIIEQCLKGKYGPLIITDYIFDEVLGVLLRKTDRETTKNFGNFLLTSELSLIHIDKHVFYSAWEVFKKREQLSFTDCTIIAFMQLHGINTLATFDKYFKNIQGLTIIDT